MQAGVRYAIFVKRLPPSESSKGEGCFLIEVAPLYGAEPGPWTEVAGDLHYSVQSRDLRGQSSEGGGAPSHRWGDSRTGLQSHG